MITTSQCEVAEMYTVALRQRPKRPAIRKIAGRSKEWRVLDSGDEVKAESV